MIEAATIERFDVFLSYNSKDKDAVCAVAELLRDRKLKVWLDQWELPPGSQWQKELEKAIEKSRVIGVFVGPHGIGPWEDAEMRAALDLQRRRGGPIIPVALPGMPRSFELPLFLREFTWVNFPAVDDTGALDKLIWGITGEKPKSAAPAEGTAGKAPSRDVEADAAGNLAETMRYGAVTYFVGPGAFSGRDLPPGNTRLARDLLASLELKVPGDSAVPPIDLAGTVYAYRHGDDLLEKRVLGSIIERSLSQPNLYGVLADLLIKLAARPRVRGGRRAHQLVVTTNFDVLLERALLRRGLSFSRIVQYRQRPKVQPGPFGLVAADGSFEAPANPRREVQINVYRDFRVGEDGFEVSQPGGMRSLGHDDIALDDWIAEAGRKEMPASEVSFADLPKPILYKHHGSQDVPGSCIISCAHFLDFARQARDLVPLEVASTVAATPALFLGYNPLDPDFRLLFHVLLKEAFASGDSVRRYAPLVAPEQPQDDWYREVERKLWDHIVDATLEQMRIRILADTPESFLGRLERLIEKVA